MPNRLPSLCNKQQIQRHPIVASVESYKYDWPQDCKSFNDVQDFLTLVRDGKSAPDRFYLGQISALGDGAYHACFDSFHTIKLPSDPDRSAFLQKHRVGRLSNDFCRDLHLRFFTCFVSLGFDDFSWYSDKDLDVLVTAGNRDLSELRAEFAKGEARGFAKPEHKAGLTSKIQAMESKLQPLTIELQKRTGSSISRS